MAKVKMMVTSLSRMIRVVDEATRMKMTVTEAQIVCGDFISMDPRLRGIYRRLNTGCPNPGVDIFNRETTTRTTAWRRPLSSGPIIKLILRAHHNCLHSDSPQFLYGRETGDRPMSLPIRDPYRRISRNLY